MEVISRQNAFILEPNIPQTVPLLRDIDFFNTIFLIEHGPVPQGTILYLDLKSVSGQRYRTPIVLGTRGGYFNYQLLNEWAEERLSDFIFNELQIESNQPISVGISATNQIGGFMEM